MLPFVLPGNVLLVLSIDVNMNLSTLVSTGGETCFLLLLLSSHHRPLRMIPEVLELCVEGGCISHIWYICVVSHVYGGFDGGLDGGGGWYACRTKPRGLVACRITFQVLGDTLMTPDHATVQVHSSG